MPKTIASIKQGLDARLGKALTLKAHGGRKKND